MFVGVMMALWLLIPTKSEAQYQFGYLSYQKVLQNMPEYATAQTSLRTLKEKYDSEAKYNEERFRKMFADFLAGQKTFPQEIMLKRQKELQTAMEQGISFRKDTERLLTNAENELMHPLLQKMDSILAVIGRENGFIFILNTDNHDFPFIHTQAGKDLTEVAIARINGKIIPLNEDKNANESAAEHKEGSKDETVNKAPADGNTSTPANVTPDKNVNQEKK